MVSWLMQKLVFLHLGHLMCIILDFKINNMQIYK